MVVLLALAIVGLLPGFQNFYRHVVKFGFGVDRNQYHFAIGESYAGMADFLREQA
jgi:hypothetical protein